MKICPFCKGHHNHKDTTVFIYLYCNTHAVFIPK
ncbi:YgiT-type zinc finger protein [Leclercia adecarboxylata]|nr:YgiT-type zinc finger protein [Leclercia adecarboxylata]QNP31720.1 YgiT-type zinc finger protein [Leclercia adecarboxylata]